MGDVRQMRGHLVSFLSVLFSTEAHVQFPPNDRRELTDFVDLKTFCVDQGAQQSSQVVRT